MRNEKKKYDSFDDFMKEDMSRGMDPTIAFNSFFITGLFIASLFAPTFTEGLIFFLKWLGIIYLIVGVLAVTILLSYYICYRIQNKESLEDELNRNGYRYTKDKYDD